MNRIQKRKKKIQSKVFRKSAVVATLATVLIAPTVLAATNGLNELDGDKIVQYANESANFTWNDETDKWTHGNISSAKTVTIGNAKIGIYSHQEGVLTVAAGEAQYGNDYMAAPMATIPIVAGTTQYATINLADSGYDLTGTVTIAVTFAKGENPTPDKPQAPSNVTISDSGDFVTAWVGANTSTSVYDASGNKIDDGSMYMETEGRATLDLVRPLTKGEKIYVVSINPDTQVESDKTWATFMPVTAKTAVTVMGMDRDSGETLWSNVQELDSDMTHTLTSQAVEGYDLVSPEREDVYVTGDSMTHVFYYVKRAVVPEDKFSTVTIQYVDSETGQSIAPQTTISDVKVGTDYVGNAIAIDGYTLSDDASKTINVVEDANSNVISFRYTKDAPVVEKANVTVKYVDENGKSIADDKVVKDLEVGTKHTEKAITIDGYELTSEAEKTVDVQSGGSEIAFTYKVKEVNPPVDPVDPTDPTEPTNPVVPEPEQPVDPTDPTEPEKPTDNGDGNGNGNVVTDTEGTTDTTTTDTNKETTKEDSKEKETTKDSKEDKKLPDTGSKVMNSAILTSSGLVLVLGVLIMFKKRFKKSK